MSGHGHAEKSETGFVAIVAFFFFGFLLLCGMEFADSAGKGELVDGGGGGHKH